MQKEAAPAYLEYYLGSCTAVPDVCISFFSKKNKENSLVP